MGRKNAPRLPCVAEHFPIGKTAIVKIDINTLNALYAHLFFTYNAAEEIITEAELQLSIEFPNQLKKGAMHPTRRKHSRGARQPGGRNACAGWQ